MTDNMLERVGSVTLAILLLFLLPMKYISAEKQQIERIYLEQRVYLFGELASTTGALDPDSWQQLNQLLPTVDLKLRILRKRYYPGSEKGSCQLIFEELGWDDTVFMLENNETVRLAAGDVIIIQAVDQVGQEIMTVSIRVRYGG